MHILRTRSMPVWMYGANVRSCINKSLRQINVSFNNTVRKIFHRNRLKSVNAVLRGLNMKTMDLHVQWYVHDHFSLVKNTRVYYCECKLANVCIYCCHVIGNNQ